MNCPSRPDEDAIPNGWNQNPPPLALLSNQGLNGMANLRSLRDHRLLPEQLLDAESTHVTQHNNAKDAEAPLPDKEVTVQVMSRAPTNMAPADAAAAAGGDDGLDRSDGGRCTSMWDNVRAAFRKYLKFIGPGFMIAVAYIDPGNYATDVAAGATFQYRLLVMVLVSNLIAIFLQSLCIKLGSVTGMNLAENIKAHCPPWLNYVLWFFAEAAIIATDVAEVIGTAIALNLLINVPLVAGCAISIVDVLLILIFYRPSGSMRGVRVFEIGVAALVLGVVICFAVELSLIHVPDVGRLFRGYLPSSTLVQGKGLYQACGILGATVMPHSLYLGSGIVQPRLREYDEKHGITTPAVAPDAEDKGEYRPSLAAIQSCLKYSVLELAISLFTFALFVNSAILIVSGASLFDNANAASADLFGIHDLLSQTLAPVAGTIFALALLLSGTSAGVVCTIAGQMVSEGQLTWTMKPWQMRLMTRSISITPSIIIAGAVGKEGLSAALEGSQVALSVILPITSAPLIYFTCRNKFMTVGGRDNPNGAKMRNGWIMATFAILLWLLLVVMNVALLVLLGMGVE